MRRGLAMVLALVALAAGPSPAGGAAVAAKTSPPPSTYLVGAAKRSINPDPDGTFAGRPVFLGGYGFGSGPLWEGIGTSRPPASGILDPGIFVRAFVVSESDDPREALVLASIETQGYFVAYQQGPYGLHDMRKAVEATVGIPAERVIIGGNHTHAGPDTLGVWGGVPAEYLRFVRDQAVGAVADAWAARRRAHLFFGTADATALLSNQFDYDPANTTMDAELRVLQAREPGTDRVIATLLNLSAHPTVLGSGNTRVSADWPGPVAEGLPGEGVVIVGALGRSQPRDGPSFEACSGDEVCALHDYAARVLAVADQALDAAKPLKGKPRVDAHSYLITDPSHHGLLLAFVHAGRPAGVPIDRSFLPPWEAGPVIGTVTFSARIGKLLISGGPGELYPQIPEAVRDAVAPKGHFTFGLAGDMLGYLIAPFPEAYPEPIRRTFFSRGNPHTDPTTWQVDPVSNDNYFFNVSHTLGERVICSMLRGAGDVFGAGPSYWQGRPTCAAFANDAALPPGADTLVPSGVP